MSSQEKAPSPKKESDSSPEKKAVELTPEKKEASPLKKTVISSDGWDVWSPPPVDSLKGHFVPESFVRYSRRRHVTVEVHRITLSGGAFYEECVIRMLKSANPDLDKASRKRGKAALKVQKELRRAAAQLGPATKISVNGKKRTEEQGLDDDDMSVGSSVSTASTTAGVFVDVEGGTILGEDGQPAWIPKHKFPLDAVVINKVSKNKVQTTTTFMGVRHSRSIIFDSDQEAKDFNALIEFHKTLEKARADQKLRAVLGGIEIKSGEKVSLLIEIVSAGNLPVADLSSSDPYVVASLNRKQLHKTDYISKSLDPIWTVKTGSLFLLEITAKELFSNADGVMFQVFDFDQFGGNESLGAAFVPPKILYEGTGERMEFPLQKAPRQRADRDYTGSFLAIRCRHATEYDKKFMEQYTTGDKKPDHLDPSSVEAKAMTVSGGKSGIHSMVSRNRKISKHGPDAGVYLYKVRPSPDPEREEETEWLSEEKIDELYLEESRHWLDIGSGQVGRLFVEILKCDGLPQLDTGLAGNKTDAFASVIFEDGIMKTDIIDDCLSPRWLPWSKRAFIFHMLHSSSPLYLGIFDYDGGSFDDHDLIGRVAVDVSNLRADMVCVQTYEIFSTASMTERKSKGTITIRMRLEIDDERQRLLANLEPPPQIYVNVSNKKDFHVARQTLSGKYNENEFNMKLLYAYIDELTAYKYATYYLQDALLALFLWRGHTSVSIFGKEFKLPIHSLNSFLVCVLLVERPQLAPSFFFATIGWLMLAVMGFRRNSPNPWIRCRSFFELLQVLILGKPLLAPRPIEAFENEEEARKFVEDFQNRVKEAEEEAEKVAEENAKLEEEREKELAELGDLDTDISSMKRGGVTINPYRAFLWPAQQYLCMVVKAIRLGKNIILWEECYFAFWITLGCFVLSIVFFFVPWFWLMKWTSRVVVWTFFGPWMKLVDIFYVSKIQPLSEDDKEKQLDANREKQREANAAFVKEARITKENTKKMKDVKKYMFGKYITRVPVLKQERYIDNPLPESYSTRYEPEPLGLADLAMRESGYNRTRLPGQFLVGDMIPRVETKAFTDAPVGKPTAHPDRLEKDSPGRISGTDSTAAAYAKIGGLVVAAGVITWFSVPRIISFAEWMLGMKI